MENKTELAKQISAALETGSLVEVVADLDFNNLGEAGTVLTEFHNDGTVDALDFFNDLKWGELSRRDQMRMTTILEACISGVRSQPERSVSFFHNVATRIPQHHAYLLHNAFESWAIKNSSQLNEVSELISNADEDSPYIGQLLHAWRKTAPAEALAAAIAYTSDTRPKIKHGAIFALGTFHYEKAEDALPAVATLTELLQSTTSEECLTAIAACSNLLDNQPEPIDELVKHLETLSQDPTPDTRDALIKSHVHNKNAYPDKLRTRVFELMKTVSDDWPATLNNLDLALYQLDFNEDRQIIFEILTAVLSQGVRAPTLKTFDSLTQKLKTAEHDLLCWFTTRWLLDGEYAICSQLNDLFPPLTTEPYDFDLQRFDLKPADVFYLARKAFVYLMFCRGAAVSLLCGCLMELKLDHRKELEAEISAFWLRNFPSDIDIFEAASKSFPRKGLKAAITRIRSQITKYETPLRNQPNNPALKPSTMERRVQSELARERSRNMGRTVQENSILSMFAHKSTLLYGRTSVTYIYPGEGQEPIRQVVPMKSYETSTAIPRMDVLYPTRLNFLLHKFRTEKRPT